MVYFPNIWQHKHAALRSAHEIAWNFGHSSIWHAPCKAKDKPPRQGWQIFEGQNFEGATTMTTAFKNRKTFSAAICAALLFGPTMILNTIGQPRPSNVGAAESAVPHQALPPTPP